MFTYVTLITWTDQGNKDMKACVERAEAARQGIEQLGGRVNALLWTQGRFDALVITEWPDEETAMAMGLLVKMSGNDRIETMRAFNAEAMQRILQKMP